MKTTFVLKNSLNGIHRRQDRAKELIPEFKDKIATETKMKFTQ